MTKTKIKTKTKSKTKTKTKSKKTGAKMTDRVLTEPITNSHLEQLALDQTHSRVTPVLKIQPSSLSEAEYLSMGMKQATKWLSEFVYRSSEVEEPRYLLPTQKEAVAIILLLICEKLQEVSYPEVEELKRQVRAGEWSLISEVYL